MNKAVIDREEPLNHVNEEITNVEQIENTPFSVVKFNDKYFLALGKYRLSELMDSRDDVIKDADDTSWLRLLSIIHAVSSETARDIYETINSKNNDKEEK